MPKWILDGINAEAYRGLGKKLYDQAHGRNKGTVTYGAAVATVGQKILIKSRMPNFAMYAHSTETGQYHIALGGAYGESVISPFIAANLSKPGEFGYINTSQMVYIGQRKFMFLLRTNSDSFFLPMILDQTKMHAYCLGFSENYGAALEGATYYNAVGACIEPVGEFAPGESYTAIWYTAPVGDAANDIIQLVKTVDASQEWPGYLPVWPPAADINTHVVSICSISAGVLAILYFRANVDDEDNFDPRPALRIRNVFTATDIIDIPLKDIDARFEPIESGGNTYYPDIEYGSCMCVTDVGVVLLALKPDVYNNSLPGVKIFGNTPFSLSWTERYDFGPYSSIYLGGAVFGERNIHSMAPGHAVSLLYRPSQPNVFVTTLDGGYTWEETAINGSQIQTLTYPFGATPAHYTPDETGKLIPDVWAWPDYEMDSIKIKTYSEVMPTEESKLCTIPLAFAPVGLNNAYYGVSIGWLAYCGDEAGRIPLKPGHDGVLEFAE